MTTLAVLIVTGPLTGPVAIGCARGPGRPDWPAWRALWLRSGPPSLCSPLSCTTLP